MFAQLGLPSWASASTMRRACHGNTSSNRMRAGGADLDHTLSSEQAQADTHYWVCYTQQILWCLKAFTSAVTYACHMLPCILSTEG